MSRRPPAPRTTLIGRPTVRSMIGLLLVVAGLGLAACGSEEASTLDAPATESAVGRVVSDRAGLPAARTTCPDDIPRGKGRTVRCTVILGKGAGTIRVSVRQVDEDGQLDVVLLDALVDNAEVTAALKRQLKASFARSFQADCGTGKRVVPPGGTFRCRARDRNGRRVVVVTVKDAAGTLSFRVLT